MYCDALEILGSFSDTFCLNRRRKTTFSCRSLAMLKYLTHFCTPAEFNYGLINVFRSFLVIIFLVLPLAVVICVSPQRPWRPDSLLGSPSGGPAHACVSPRYDLIIGFRCLASIDAARRPAPSAGPATYHQSGPGVSLAASAPLLHSVMNRYQSV